MRLSIGLLGVVAALGLSAGPALAQKSGGTLKMYIADNPPSTSIHEEATTSTVVPFMGIYNNLVVFDQQIRRTASRRSVRIWPRAGHGVRTARS